MENLDVIIPISEYKYMTDYDDNFFENKYPIMWKNACLYVETYLSSKIIEKIHNQEKNALESNLARNPDYIQSYVKYMQWDIERIKLAEAQKIMRKQLKALGCKRYEEEKYILTEEEQKELEKDAKRKLREKYITIIDKNGLYIKIDKKEKKSIFKYKDWPKYTINTGMYLRYKRDLEEREEEMIRQCAEAWLHYSWIAQIFWTDERRMSSICKKLGLDNVFATPQKLMKKLPRIRVFEPNGYFIVEKENHLLKEKNKA